MIQKVLSLLCTYLFLALALVVLFVPIGTALWASFQQETAPGHTAFSVANYVKIAARPGLVRSLWNSLVAAVGCATLVTISASLGAYSLARYAPPGTQALLGWIISLRMFPILLALIPLFRFFLTSGLGNSLWGTVLAQGAFSLPFAFWLSLSYFRQVPPERYDAAEVDGASVLTVFRHVVWPAIHVGIGVVAFYAFVLSWNDYLIVSVVTQSMQKATLPFTLVNLLGSVQGDERVVLALVNLLALPPMVLYVFVQRQREEKGLFTPD